MTHHPILGEILWGMTCMNLRNIFFHVLIVSTTPVFIKNASGVTRRVKSECYLLLQSSTFQSYLQARANLFLKQGFHGRDEKVNFIVTPEEHKLILSRQDLRDLHQASEWKAQQLNRWAKQEEFPIEFKASPLEVGTIYASTHLETFKNLAEVIRRSGTIFNGFKIGLPDTDSILVTIPEDVPISMVDAHDLQELSDLNPHLLTGKHPFSIQIRHPKFQIPKGTSFEETEAAFSEWTMAVQKRKFNILTLMNASPVSHLLLKIKESPNLETIEFECPWFYATHLIHHLRSVKYFGAPESFMILQVPSNELNL